MFYVFHGEEEFTRSEEVTRLKQLVAETGLGDLNIAVLDGRRLQLGALMDACNALPFLGDRRLVIVEDFLARFEPSATSAERDLPHKLVAYLSDLPATTRLVFVDNKTLSKRNPVLKGVGKIPDSYQRHFALPGSRDLHLWIETRVRVKGTTIAGPAASLLASMVGPNLRMLDAELEKLAAHAGYARPIADSDVRQLVSAAHESSIFALVDALGLRQRQAAMRELHALIEDGANELYLLAMIARQVRLILSVKDLAERGMQPEELRRTLHISHRFILEKLSRQARQFSMEELEGLLERLLGIDHFIKTGRADGALAIEMLVLETCRRQPGGVRHQRSSRSRRR